MRPSPRALMHLSVIEIEIETATEIAIEIAHETMLQRSAHREAHHAPAIVLVAITRAMEIVARAVDARRHSVPRSAGQRP